ncbi:DsbA family oxidoreductase [Sinirhodobacter ferrireducens]|uniref:DsbA family oxidoreductase n=1 Tax=Paenirhodobacter ferrireducens TaxID=1215032 RepID=A0A443LTE7_9RHOB|nr:DsbA family oxidoreductase [Sinirhodobacter ferrireducens]RWR52444.1 DsbA family oxidoreductase [Sinirhodobacter ferrireducens]
MIPLDIFADPVCPWCLIGKANLDRALEARPGHPFVLAWHPFRLDPTMPPGGMARGDYMRAKFGAEADTIDIPVLEAARRAGVTLDLTAIARVPNTLDAHRLLHWAGIEGRQTPVMSALMRAFWREGRDIGAPEVLAGIAEAAGMDRALVMRLLASDADRDEVLAREAHARERGIRAVPSFIIGNQHMVEGAQPVETWLAVIDELAAAPQADPEAEH